MRGMPPALRSLACLLLAAFALAASTPCLEAQPATAAQLELGTERGAAASARIEPACPCGCGKGALPSALHSLDPALLRATPPPVAIATSPLPDPAAATPGSGPRALPDPVPIGA